jgi:replicative DNA helicase
MDLSRNIIRNEQEIESLRERSDFLDALESYDGEDNVMRFTDVVAELQKRDSGSASQRVYSKIPTLDTMTDGFRPGQLVVLSAPTGNGKTAFLQSLTRTFSENEIPCLWFSYEMPILELAERYGADIPRFEIPRKNVNSSFDWLKLRSLEGIAKFGTRVIFIDHLHYLLDMKMLSGSNTSLVIGGLMRELKKFALETETTIFLVSHMAKTKIDEVPTISDLRDSSFVAQESDIVMVMWRHREKDRESPTGYRFTDESRLIVDKNRWNGKLGYVKMIFRDGRFTEVMNTPEGLPEL